VEAPRISARKNRPRSTPHVGSARIPQFETPRNPAGTRSSEGFGELAGRQEFFRSTLLSHAAVRRYSLRLSPSNRWGRAAFSIAFSHLRLDADHTGPMTLEMTLDLNTQKSIFRDASARRQQPRTSWCALQCALDAEPQRGQEVAARTASSRSMPRTSRSMWLSSGSTASRWFRPAPVTRAPRMRVSRRRGEVDLQRSIVRMLLQNARELGKALHRVTVDLHSHVTV
jgi:hypothetical protein